MKLSQRFRKWFARRGALALFFIAVFLLLVFQIWLERPQPRNAHVIGSSTQHVDTLWFKQGDLSNIVAANADGVVFIMPLTEDSITAIDAQSANAIWKVELPFERRGLGSLLTNQNMIFAVQATRVSAYEAKTGELKWSTELGDGHVAVIPQLDSGVLRIYYGDKLIELDPETGKILTVMPKGATVWISGNIVFKASSAYSPIDRQTGRPLWSNNRSFYVDEGQEPINIGNDNLLVGFSPKGVCALNLKSGDENWCHLEINISDVAVDRQSQLGYAMREDLVLLTIDLQTGNVLGETRFLSSKPIDQQIGFMSSIIFSDGVLVISFSDSGQTFGLSFQPASR